MPCSTSDPFFLNGNEPMTGTNQASTCPRWAFWPCLQSECFLEGLDGLYVWPYGWNCQRRPKDVGPMLVYWNYVFESNRCGMTVLMVLNSTWTELKTLSCDKTLPSSGHCVRNLFQVWVELRDIILWRQKKCLVWKVLIKVHGPRFKSKAVSPASVSQQKQNPRKRKTLISKSISFSEKVQVFHCSWLSWNPQQNFTENTYAVHY